ncbi:MAG: sugar ABC transporter substrate-binding protein [Oscillospiraceae bacterium]|nr:sugar ABC transporter substrate-binding protein [Oscillospiraceae bacterium]
MKKISKLLALVLVVVLSVSLLAACGEKENTSSPPAPETTSESPNNTGNSNVSTNPADYWDPSKGPPPSFDLSSAVYSMDNRVPWQGIFSSPESSRASINKAIQASNKKDKVKVGYATWTVGSPFFAGMMDTIKAECDKYGWELVSMVSDADIAQQVANIENFVTLGVDVIIDCAFSGDAEAIAIQKAVDAGIPSIGLGLPFPDGTPLVTNAATMYYEQGFMVGMYAANEFKGIDVKAAFNPGGIGHPISDSKLNGFIGGFVYGRAIQLGKPFATREEAMLYGYDLHQKIVGSAKFSDPDHKWEVVASIDGSWVRDGGQKATEDILTAHPDINFMFADNDEQAQGAILAMNQAGLKPGADIKICCVGDGSRSALQLIQDGSILCLTLASPYTWSKACTDLAHMIFNDGFDATNLPSNVFLDNVLVDKSNVSQHIPPGNEEYTTLPDQQFVPIS